MKKILIADDNAVSRELLREILQVCDYEIFEASDGRETIEKITQTTPDLVLLDIQMPELDGFMVVRWLRRDPRFAALPVLAVTAYSMRGDKERAIEAGFTGYVTKPVDARSLRQQIVQLLDE